MIWRWLWMLGLLFFGGAVNAASPILVDIDTSYFPEIRFLTSWAAVAPASMDVEERIGETIQKSEALVRQVGDDAPPWEIIFVVDNRPPTVVDGGLFARGLALYTEVLTAIRQLLPDDARIGIVSFGEGSRGPLATNPNHSSRIILEPTSDRSQLEKALSFIRVNYDDTDYLWPSLKRAAALSQHSYPAVYRRLIIALLHKPGTDRNEQIPWSSSPPRAIIYTVGSQSYEYTDFFRSTIQNNGGDIITVRPPALKSRANVMVEGIQEAISRAAASYQWVTYETKDRNLDNLQRQGRFTGLNLPDPGIPFIYEASHAAVHAYWLNRLRETDASIVAGMTAIKRTVEFARRDRDQGAGALASLENHVKNLLQMNTDQDKRLRENAGIRRVLNESTAIWGQWQSDQELHRSNHALLAAHRDLLPGPARESAIRSGWEVLGNERERHLPLDAPPLREALIQETARAVEQALGSERTRAEARSLLQLAVEGGAGDDLRIIAARGRMHLARGEWDDAFEHLYSKVFERMARGTPGRKEVGLDAIVALAESQPEPDRLIRVVDQVLRELDDAARLPARQRLIYASALAGSGRASEAIAEAAKVMGEPGNPDRALAADILASTSHDIGRWNEAMIYLEQLEQLDPALFVKNPLSRDQ